MTKVTARQGGELALIQSIRGRICSRSSRLTLGIGDDCALLRPKPGEEIAVTTDFSLENVHFRRDWHPPESVGHRCLARGLSDLAAVGATPVAAFLSLAVPRELIRNGWLDRFLNGMLALADRFKVPLAGGDTAESPQSRDGGPGLVSADIVLIGAVKRGRALLRSGAQAGDVIYATGGLGGAAAALIALEQNPAQFARFKRAAAGHPHLYPEPKLSVGYLLSRKRLVTAAIDLSDGLSTDLRHICEESGLAAEIDASAIPIHPMALLAEAAGWAPSALDLALHGGEDYELLFTASGKTKIPVKISGVAVTAIGRMRKRRRGRNVMEIKDSAGKRMELTARGWEHFRH